MVPPSSGSSTPRRVAMSQSMGILYKLEWQAKGAVVQ